MKKTFLALAPIRICDLGGWTDTWFARHGKVLNIAVKPYAQCLIEVDDRPAAGERFFITVDDYGDRYRIDPQNVEFGRHPLLDACVKSLPVPRGLDVEVSLHSAVPGGSSTGTSAAVTVALIGALDCLSARTSRRLMPDELAARAHEVETVLLRQQSGIQDQLCSAYGGISFIEMDDYPHSKVTRVPVARAVRDELDRRLVLVFLGRSHYSTTVHEEVIRGLTGVDGDAKLDPLRKEAVAGCDALISGDLAAFGRAMVRNVEAQADLNAALVSEKARRVFEIAKRHGAFGWKVNGAGGDGGSVTILSGDDPRAQAEMVEEINALGDGIREIGVRLDDFGMRIVHG